METLARHDRAAVKVFLMDQAIVVGVGNIYASEALFAAGIHPKRAAGSISRARYARLADEVKRVLEYSIKRGGTTLRDFINPDSEPGYFEQELFVYGREGRAVQGVRHADSRRSRSDSARRTSVRAASADSFAVSPASGSPDAHC